MKCVLLTRYRSYWSSVPEALADRCSTDAISEISALERVITDAEILVASNTGFPQKSIDRGIFNVGNSLKLIQLLGVSWDIVDLEDAQRVGVPVATVPGRNAVSVAELAVSLLLQAVRPARGSEDGYWLGSSVGEELQRKTVAIIEFGRIGKELADRLVAFRMHVLAVDPQFEPRRTSRERDGAPSAHFVDLKTALSEAHFIVLSLPLTEASVSLLNAETLSEARSGVVIVNIARAAIVDRGALTAALHTGKVAVYATDVWWKEPRPSDDPLCDNERVIYTPHIGGMTREAVRRTINAVADNVARLAAGKLPRHVVSEDLR